MLFLAELLWVPLTQSTDDGERGQLRLRSKSLLPGLDPRKIGALSLWRLLLGVLRK